MVLRFSGGYYEGWVGVSGEFNQLQVGGGAVFNYKFTISDCNAESLIIIDQGYFRHNLQLKGEIIAEKVRIGFPDKKFTGELFINELVYETEKPLNLVVLNNPVINTIKFKNITVNKDSRLFFSDIKVNKISFDNFNNQGYISFKDIISTVYHNTDIKMLRLKEAHRREDTENWIRPVAVLTGDNDVKAKLVISYSNLGKIDFIGCNLSVFNLVFAFSKITEVFLAGTHMPISIDVPEDKIDDLHTQRRLGYSQIKKIFENRGDTVEAGNYYAKEMDAHYESLNYIENWWEKTNLLLSKISSYYGQSWKRGLISLFIVSTILFSLYTYALGYRLSLPATNNTLNNCYEVISYLFEFMNPIRRADYIPEQLYIFHYSEKPIEIYQIPRLARIIDVLSRVVIGFFLYQFVQAFRKYGKKGV